MTSSTQLDPEQATVEHDLYCLYCGYSLRGLPGDAPVCPECGAINPLDERRVRPAVVAQMRRHLSRAVIASTLVLLAGLAVMMAGPAGILVGAVLIFMGAMIGSSVSAVTKAGAPWRWTWLLVYQAYLIMLIVLVLIQPLCASWLSAHWDHWQWPAAGTRRFVLTVAQVTVVLLLGWPLGRFVRRPLDRRMDERSQEMAEQWHRQRLRTPEAQRSAWWRGRG